jgi:hypothetical protein
MSVFILSAVGLPEKIRNDRHRSGAILIRDHVIDHYFDRDRPKKEHLINLLISKLSIKRHMFEHTANKDANDPKMNHTFLSEGDIRRGVKKAYRKLEEGSVKIA